MRQYRETQPEKAITPASAAAAVRRPFECSGYHRLCREKKTKKVGFRPCTAVRSVYSNSMTRKGTDYEDKIFKLQMWRNSL